MAGALLDTHTFLWVASDSPNLSSAARRTLSLRSTTPYISVVSLWEIAMKIALGSLRLDVSLDELIEREFAANGYVRLEIADHHLMRLLDQPHPEFAHGDPFDRLLAAQAVAEGLEMLSADEKLDAYGVQRIW